MNNMRFTIKTNEFLKSNIIGYYHQYYTGIPDTAFFRGVLDMALF